MREEAPFPASAALASPPRRRLFEMLRADGAAEDAHRLASAAGLHVSTVRFHLDVLARAGLVTSWSQPRGTAGRPRTVYRAVARAEPRGYQALTGLLAAALADTPQARTARAEQAGLAWAAELATGTERHPPLGAEAAVRAVTGLFTDLGFDPELVGGEGDRQIRLRDCPFRDAARAHPEVVCAVHLGLLRGTLNELGAPPTTTTLQPFVEPELCLAQLSVAG